MADLESALNGAFSDAPPEQPKAAPEPVPEPVEQEDDSPAYELDQQEEDAPQQVEAGPEASFEIEVDGRPETVSGNDRIKELIGRGLKASRGYEENARVREALAAHIQQATIQQTFQRAVFQDITQLQAIDQQLEQWNRVDWNAAYDSDPFAALKLKEQRDQLREQRNQLTQQINAKQQQFQAGLAQTQQQVLAAEQQALLARVPEWRNGEKARTETAEINAGLAQHYGFNAQEIGGVTDHRMVLVARDAIAYRRLMAGKDSRIKQVRSAPPVVKPGAAQPNDKGKANFVKNVQDVRKAGRQGNHKAQEALVTAMLGRVFKP